MQKQNINLFRRDHIVSCLLWEERCECVESGPNTASPGLRELSLAFLGFRRGSRAAVSNGHHLVGPALPCRPRNWRSLPAPLLLAGFATRRSRGRLLLRIPNFPIGAFGPEAFGGETPDKGWALQNRAASAPATGAFRPARPQVGSPAGSRHNAELRLYVVGLLTWLWQTARQDPLLATLCTGPDRSVMDGLGQMSFGEIQRVGAAATGFLEARFCRHPRLWPDLLRAARTRNRQVILATQLSVVQLTLLGRRPEFAPARGVLRRPSARTALRTGRRSDPG